MLPCRVLTVMFLALLTCTTHVFAQNQLSPQTITYQFRSIDFPGATSTSAYGVNNSGEVVGFYVGDGCTQASCGFTDINGTFASVECTLENATDFFDISNTGEIVGAYSFFGGVHGFIWQGNSSCFDIVDPSGPSLTEAFGVNDNGDVVGFYLTSVFQGFQYTNGTYTNIACSGFTNTRAFDINNADIIVGDNSSSTSGPFSGFRLKNGLCQPVTYPGSVWTSVRGINKNNALSGWYTDSAGLFHGFIDKGNVFQSIDYPGATNTFVYHINDKGWVAGIYTDASGVSHGFVARPQ